MKYMIIVIFLIAIQLSCFAQQTVYGSIMHDDIERDYILYIPADTGDLDLPLVLNFHGYGSNATEQMNYGDFRSIADSAGFFIVHPQGTLFQGVTHWNVGGWTVGSSVDDVGFTAALIDSLSSEYNIDQDRVYSTGMSNGGFMSFLLASQLSERIAAIASVTGSMTPETYNNSNPLHPTPILQMHGTSDDLVSYGGTAWSQPIVDVLQYWAEYNNCNDTPTITALPDVDPNDGSTVELYVYDEGDYGVSVEHYKVIGGAHTWPGNTYGGAGTNNDINASLEIWNFFARYDINGLINPAGIEDDSELEVITYELKNYPNPFNPSGAGRGPSTVISFTAKDAKAAKVDIYNIKGQRVVTLSAPRQSECIEGRQDRNTYSITWNGTDYHNKTVSSGIYYAVLISGNRILGKKKMVLIK